MWNSSRQNCKNVLAGTKVCSEEPCRVLHCVYSEVTMVTVFGNAMISWQAGKRPLHACHFGNTINSETSSVAVKNTKTY